MKPEETKTQEAPTQPATEQTPARAEAGPAVVMEIHPKKQKATPPKEPVNPPLPKKRKKRTWPKLIVYLLFASAVGVAFFQRQNILDWYALRDYQPSNQIVQLADNSFMNNYGRKLFYINDPQIQEKKVFYNSCREAEAVVLGCFKPRDGIFLLEVTDERLAGVEEVTAAHEMLHAAYQRLGYNKKQEINSLLKKTYNELDDENIKEKIDLYLESGADTNNELHSILGTEVADLPAELEQYYSQYFTNRAGVVALSDKFENVFTSRRLKVDELDGQLSSIESQVKANNQKLVELEQSINQEAARLEALLAENKIEEYNQGVASYNNSLIPYRTLQSETRGLIAEYKTILTQRNNIAIEVQELSKPLNSNISTDSKDL